MTLIRIGWRNLWRHKRRTLITAAGMSVAMGMVLAVACLQDGMWDLMSDVLVRQTLGHAQVTHPEWPARQLMYDTVPASTVEAIEGLEGVVGTAPTMAAFGLAASDVTSTGARYIGVDPARHAAVTDLSTRIKEGRFIGDAPANEAVIGVGMAKELEIGVGDELVVLGQAADGSMANELYTVVGTYSTGQAAMDKAGAYLHLADMQRLLALEDQVHQILVVGLDMEASDALVAAVTDVVPNGGTTLVRSWQEADPNTAKMMAMRNVGTLLMLFIIFSVAGLAVLNTMLMSVFERTAELGVLRAIGLSRGKMVLLILVESVLMVAVATVGGLVLGGFLDWLLIEYGLPYTIEGSEEGLTMMGITFPTVLKGTLRLDPFIWTISFVFFVAIAAAIWPALRAAFMRPVEAMREMR